MKTSAIAAIVLLTTAACTQDPATGDGRQAGTQEIPADETVRPTDDRMPPGGNDAMPAAGRDAATPPRPGDDTAAMSAAGDGEALGLVGAINRHEIEMARQAQEKGVEGDVLEYAQKMEKEHGDNQRKLEALGRAQQTGAVRAQEQKGHATHERLEGMSGQAYSDAYVEAMVKDHAEALALLTDTLIPAATDEAVRAHLQTTSEAVRRHLEEAQALQGGARQQR